jgi:hypothetical protein
MSCSASLTTEANAIVSPIVSGSVARFVIDGQDWGRWIADAGWMIAARVTALGA